MKKTITSALIFASLILTVCGCQMENNAIPQNTVTSTETEYTETTEHIETLDEFSSDASNGLFLEPEPYCDRELYSVWRDQDGEFYIYIKEWNIYRKINSDFINSGYGSIFDPMGATINEDTAAIAVYEYSKHDATVTIHHLDRNHEDVASYTNQLDHLEDNFYECGTFFINMRDEETTYFFYTASCPDENMYDDLYWPLVRFETTDGGKTWRQAETMKLGLTLHDYPNVITFLSHNVGIISFRYHSCEDLCGRTFLTTDGGMTWNAIAPLPYPFDDINKVGYTEVIALEQRGNDYFLTVEVHYSAYHTNNPELDDVTETIQFQSTDLTQWILIH